MGSGHGAGRSRRVHHRHQRPGLLLRSAESVATGNEREHEPPPTPILPERHDALRVLAGRPQPRGAATQSTPSEDARLSFTCGSLRGTRCVDRLSPRRLSSRWKPDEGDRADKEGFRPSPLPPVCRARLPARYSSGTSWQPGTVVVVVPLVVVVLVVTGAAAHPGGASA